MIEDDCREAVIGLVNFERWIDGSMVHKLGLEGQQY